jgi:hypothetical protein
MGTLSWHNRLLQHKELLNTIALWFSIEGKSSLGAIQDTH